MDLNNLLYCLPNIIRVRATTKVNGNRMLAGSYADDWGRTRKEFPVFREITDSKGCRHDDESQRLEYAISKETGQC